MAVQSKAQFCDLSSVEIMGSNPIGTWMSVCCECCVLSGRGRCDDHSSRGVLPTVVRRCVLSRNLMNEEALVHWGLSRQTQITKSNIRKNIGNLLLLKYF